MDFPIKGPANAKALSEVLPVDAGISRKRGSPR